MVSHVRSEDTREQITAKSEIQVSCSMEQDYKCGTNKEKLFYSKFVCRVLYTVYRELNPNRK